MRRVIAAVFAVGILVSGVQAQETVGRSEVYMSSVGEATMILELLDSESGAVLAYVEDRRKMEKPGGGRIDSMTMPTNSVTVWSDVGRWARSAASRLRSELEKAQKKARKGS